MLALFAPVSGFTVGSRAPAAAARGGMVKMPEIGESGVAFENVARE